MAWIRHEKRPEDALRATFESLMDLAKSLNELVVMHEKGAHKVVIETSSLEIAADAMEIMLRALKVDIRETVELRPVPSVVTEKPAEGVKTVIFQHPPVLYKEIVRDEPPIYLYRNFLTELETQYLIQKAEGLWIPSLTGKVEDMKILENSENPMENLKVAQSEHRTSWSCVMDVDDPVVQLIVDRVALISGYPSTHVERLSLVRYEPGQKSSVHHDGVFRPKTVFIYLNSLPDDGGGETYFPRLGIKFTPTQGLAVMWNNALPDGSADQRVVHSALPPTSITKYGVNCFVNKAARTQKPPDTVTCVH